MKGIITDARFRLILMANIASSIGTGITMIAVPWLLVTSENGNVLFGFITLGMTLLNFIITPYIGTLVDRVSRKSLLLTSEMLCLLAILIFAILGFAGQTYTIWHYTVIFMIGSLYYTIFYPTMFAMNQEIFDKSQYKSLNGTMEVQGQLSSMIAGAVASFLLIHWELQSILLLNVASYAAAAYFYLRLPYQKMKVTKKVNKRKSGWDGLLYLKERPALFIFLFFSTMPFLGVMITNYLFPVYLSDVMKVSGDIYALENMIYAIGAITAGMAIPVIAKKFGNESTMIVGVALYCVAISLIVFVSLPIYLSLMFFLALGNCGTRVARNSFMMDHIPNEIIGRVDSLFRTAGLLFRLIALALFTKMISSEMIIICFLVLSGMLIIAALAVFVSSRKGLVKVTEEKLS
ncbi:MFS transporter [Ureibacillus acetophenoni]|uniref:Na+/melibiose symporter-like transporter n=1 Tax=Ureibacillus acetophenoni TaxID=614649 RepID=A0A285UI09_9BACL|nr:MFS transporter [Ureibacillus acetophenoni]SOC41545.1 Na+/melibiose symporter-like transporter [Ureibacillus acetophenoni]